MTSTNAAKARAFDDVETRSNIVDDEGRLE